MVIEKAELDSRAFENLRYYFDKVLNEDLSTIERITIEYKVIDWKEVIRSNIALNSLKLQLLEAGYKIEQLEGKRITELQQEVEKLEKNDTKTTS